MSFNSRHRHLHSTGRSLRLFASHGNVYESIYNGRRTNAAAEASYDRAWSSDLQQVHFSLIFQFGSVW